MRDHGKRDHQTMRGGWAWARSAAPTGISFLLHLDVVLWLAAVASQREQEFLTTPSRDVSRVPTPRNGSDDAVGPAAPKAPERVEFNVVFLNPASTPAVQMNSRVALLDESDSRAVLPDETSSPATTTLQPPDRRTAIDTAGHSAVPEALPPSVDSPLPLGARSPPPSAPTLNLHAAAASVAAGKASPTPIAPGALFKPTRLPDAPRGAASMPALDRRADGTYRGDDLVFEASIDREGRMTLADKPNASVQLGLPSGQAAKERASQWADDPAGVEIDERRVETQTVPVVGGSFDLTDAALRSLGVDPYYTRKRDYYERTREFRLELRQSANAESLRRVPQIVGKNLRAVWSANEPLATRKQLIFRLWDECAETGPEELLRAASEARRLILEFVNKKLPPGSPHAYSPEELSTLNRGRNSKQRFDPYGRSPSP